MNPPIDPNKNSGLGDSAQPIQPGAGLLRWIGSIPNLVKIAIKDAKEQTEATAGPTVRERQRELIEFYDRFEETVEVLLDAAQFGPTPALEAKYQALKSYMDGHYPNVRPYAVAFLKLSVEDEAFGLAVAGRGTDAFETITVAECLESMLANDDGGMISRITRSREALTLYAEHLRYLVSRAN